MRRSCSLCHRSAHAAPPQAGSSAGRGWASPSSACYLTSSRWSATVQSWSWSPGPATCPLWKDKAKNSKSEVFICCIVTQACDSGFKLGIVDREWALCMRHQISLPPTIWVIDNLCTAGLAACWKKSRDQFFPRQHCVTRGAHHLGIYTSMLCLWGCGSRGRISLLQNSDKPQGLSQDPSSLSLGWVVPWLTPVQTGKHFWEEFQLLLLWTIYIFS